MKIFEIIADAPRSFMAGVVSLHQGTSVRTAALTGDRRVEKPRGFRVFPATLQHPRKSVRWLLLDPLI
ncbi:hypothetical protein EIL87_16520 [Saccharopolyspora rhizosphaerae]|uniref:Uncharacterized protein n=1 Tax=Saccharopolyspora rhizosphaerae TaxID=2492662 RepID=A0A426JR53_9PSEU|nr:hypothetical protein [Saccharopolyspora rhizosphaerae]RRO15623.1 hypothetical protein EIL87_16520 [Saccharopolyspora rhizosphaerae]